MTIATRTLALAAALGIAGVAQAAPPTPVYLMKAGASDQFEIRSSKLVLGSTQNAQVRQFAQEMITDHTKSTAMVKRAALRSGLHPKPPVLQPDQRSNLAELMRAHGQERDRLYIQQQQASHQQALQLHQDYASTGAKPALKRTAGEIVPVVQHHIDMLGQISAG